MQLYARDPVQLGHAIRRLRKEGGLTQAKLAKAAGVRQPTISDVEHGKSALTRVIFQILNALEVELVFRALDTENKVFNPGEFYGG